MIKENNNNNDNNINKKEIDSEKKPFSNIEK